MTWLALLLGLARIHGLPGSRAEEREARRRTRRSFKLLQKYDVQLDRAAELIALRAPGPAASHHAHRPVPGAYLSRLPKRAY